MDLPDDQEAIKLFREEELILEATEGLCEAMQKFCIARRDVALYAGMKPEKLDLLLFGERDFTLRKLANLAGALGCRARITLEPFEPDGL